MKPIRVVVADDSPLARALLCELLQEAPDIEVVAEACDGQEALTRLRELRPDLLTLDLEMPGMHGLDVIKEIMHSRALPILVISNAASAENAYAAVQGGALDVMEKPACDAAAAEALQAKVRLLARVPVITHLRPLGLLAARQAAAEKVPPRPVMNPPGKAPATAPRLLAIASSTGGPQALAQILGQLGPDFPWPILIAQHIADGFAAGMVKWLDSICPIRVQLAKDGEVPLPGIAYVSPSERHLVQAGDGRLALLPCRPSDMYHPNCDLLLESVAQRWADQAVGLILTGMGSDGARGMAQIRARGGLTLGQDQASSAIYGMNQVAIDAGSVQQVLALPDIAPTLWRLARGTARVGAAA